MWTVTIHAASSWATTRPPSQPWKPDQQQRANRRPQDARVAPMMAPRRNGGGEDQEADGDAEQPVQVLGPHQRGLNCDGIELRRQLGGRHGRHPAAEAARPVRDSPARRRRREPGHRRGSGNRSSPSSTGRGAGKMKGGSSLHYPPFRWLVRRGGSLDPPKPDSSTSREGTLPRIRSTTKDAKRHEASHGKTDELLRVPRVFVVDVLSLGATLCPSRASRHWYSQRG